MDWQREKERLLRTLSNLGIRDEKVLAAIGRVPRHRFVPKPHLDMAYANVPLPIGEGQTISQPSMVAYMTEKLRVGTGDRVLEIGTGSGYQAAVLAEMGCEVYSVERIPALAAGAEEILRELGYRVKIRVGDGNAGWPEAAPFRGIMVTAGAKEVPGPLMEQLETGARLIVPVGLPWLQYLTIVERTREGFRHEKDIPCSFVPLVGPYSY